MGLLTRMASQRDPRAQEVKCVQEVFRSPLERVPYCWGQPGPVERTAPGGLGHAEGRTGHAARVGRAIRRPDIYVRA
jgi:hypothetical protein